MGAPLDFAALNHIDHHDNTNPSIWVKFTVLLPVPARSSLRLPRLSPRRSPRSPRAVLLSAIHDKANGRNVKIGKGILLANLGNDGRNVCDESRPMRKAEGGSTSKDYARRCDGGLTRRHGVPLSNEYNMHQP